GGGGADRGVEGGIGPPVLSRRGVDFCDRVTPLVFWIGRCIDENKEFHLVLANGGLSRERPVLDVENARRRAVDAKIKLTGGERLSVHVDGPLDVGGRRRTWAPGAAKGPDERQSATNREAQSIHRKNSCRAMIHEERRCPPCSREEGWTVMKGALPP